MKKISIMRIRAKISLMAFQKKMTVVEYMTRGILRTYDQLVQWGHYKVTTKQSEMNDRILQSLAKGNLGILISLIKMNVENGELEEHDRKSIHLSDAPT